MRNYQNYNLAFEIANSLYDRDFLQCSPEDSEFYEIILVIEDELNSEDVRTYDFDS